MPSVIDLYYQKLFDLSLARIMPLNVPKDFHGQMTQIIDLYKNDVTGLVLPVTDYMVHAATVSINVQTENSNLTKIYHQWMKDVNKNLNIDIPEGLRSFTEQYFRERWKSSFIILKLKWGKIDGYWMPTTMYVYDGASIFAKNPKNKLNTIDYYFGKPKEKDINKLRNTETETIIIRKPYSSWYDAYPTPYLARRGALYHALMKKKILNKQAEMLDTALPYQLLAKLGSDEAMRRNQMPTEKDIDEFIENYQKKKTAEDEHVYAKGLMGAYPYDVKFEELIPDYNRILDEKILKNTDKNLLSALGLIELKGFSSNREESILNPKVLVEEVVDGVLDYVALLENVVAKIQEKNSSSRKYNNNNVHLSPGIIKAFITDDMRNLIRSWYDRGLISKQSALESTTLLNFEVELNGRDRERKEKLNERLYPPVTINIERDPSDPTEPANDDKDKDKIPGSPESKNYRNASHWITCSNCKKTFDYTSFIEKGMNYISCPGCGENIDQEGNVYSAEEFSEKIYNAIQKQYVEAPYTKDNYPTQLKNLPLGARNLWIRTFNTVYEETGDENKARQAAWNNVKNKYKKVGNKWVKK